MSEQKPPEQTPGDPLAGMAEQLGASSGPAAASESRAVGAGELSDQKMAGEDLDLDFILDIPLQVNVEVGRTKMTINELLTLGQGSVIELNKLLGEPFEVLVNEKLVARGEVVIVNDRFGVRLTDIVSPNERVASLA